MILSIILFILITLIIALLLIFLFFIFFPSIKNQKNSEEHFLLSTDIGEDYTPHEDIQVTNKKAFVLCSCDKSFKIPIQNFNEMYTCFIAKSVNNSSSDCKYACLGLGDCAKVCPQEAIEIRNNTAFITTNCCGCGKCVNICPQNIITLLEPEQIKDIKCKNTNSITSCSNVDADIKIEWKKRKYFKIWKACYKLYKKMFSIIKL